jgi:hypothetical protein
MDVILSRIIERLDKIETTLGLSPNSPTDPCLDDERLSKARVARRYGTSTRGIDRERERAQRGESDFPLPEVVNGRCWWWLSKLRAYDQRQASKPDTKIVPAWLRDKTEPPGASRRRGRG